MTPKQKRLRKARREQFLKTFVPYFAMAIVFIVALMIGGK